MKRRIAIALVMSAASGPLALSARAGPCSQEIVQFEMTVRQSAENPVRASIPMARPISWTGRVKLRAISVARAFSGLM